MILLQSTGQYIYGPYLPRHIGILVYIYIYREREKERERESNPFSGESIYICLPLGVTSSNNNNNMRENMEYTPSPWEKKIGWISCRYSVAEG